MKYTIWTDGATYRSNPGPSGAGIHIEGKDGSKIDLCEPIGWGTNNTAEYEAMIGALLWCLDNEPEAVEIRSDSKLVVDQSNGDWKTRSRHLQPLQDEIRLLLKVLSEFQVDVTLVHIPREQNKQADLLSKKAAELAADELETSDAGPA